MDDETHTNPPSLFLLDDEGGGGRRDRHGRQFVGRSSWAAWNDDVIQLQTHTLTKRTVA
jgi:hypothetical protein